MLDIISFLMVGNFTLPIAIAIKHNNWHNKILVITLLVMWIISGYL